MRDFDASALDAEAERILRLNDRGGYTVPTDGLYPLPVELGFRLCRARLRRLRHRPGLDRDRDAVHRAMGQTGWCRISCFTARTRDIFRGPMSGGTETALGRGGARVPSSGISQPPVAASLAWRIYREDPEAGRDRLAALFPKLMAYHRWIIAARAESGAVAITHPWEARAGQRPRLGRGDGRDRPAGRRALHPARHRPCRRADAPDQGRLRSLHLAGPVRQGAALGTRRRSRPKARSASPIRR